MEIEPISKTDKGDIPRGKDEKAIECTVTFEPMGKPIVVADVTEEQEKEFVNMLSTEISKQTDVSWEDIVTDEMIHEYASKQSHEWWQCMMNKWNSMSKEEQEKYNQFIGFNDFSDILMNELIQALKMVTHTRKLIYEEGNLAVNVNPKPCEVVDPEGCKEISDDINDEVIRIMKLNGDL